MPVSQGKEKLKVSVQDYVTFLLCSIDLFIGNSTVRLWLNSSVFEKHFLSFIWNQIIAINLYFNIKFQSLCKLSTKSASWASSNRQVSILYIREETQEIKQAVYF